MASTIRLYVDAPLGEGASAPLTSAQAHYLQHVMRRKEGDPVLLFNARDGEFDATIETLKKKGGDARLGARKRAAGLEPDLWLLFSPVKRDAIDLIAQKATELGAARLAPVLTERTVVARVNEERLQAIATEAAEQCGRLTVPDVVAAQKLDQALADWPEGRGLIYCDEAGDNPNEEWGGRKGRAEPALEALSKAKAGPWAILIGPEGGFSPTERARLRALDFVTPVTLGPRILRADTAVFAAIALWQAALGDWRGD